MEHSSVESCVRNYPVYKARTTFVLAYLAILALFSSTVNERYIFLVMSFSLLCLLPQSPHTGQLEKRDPVGQG